MKSLLGRFALVIGLAAAGTASADDHVVASGRFSVWIPDSWVVSESAGRIDAHNPNDTVQVVIATLKDAEADIGDEDVTDFIDEEIDDMKITRDEIVPFQGHDKRVIEGTGTDEGDAVSFRAEALDPGGAVLIALVYGDAGALARDNVSRAVDRILRSVKPM